jgi:4a-hydroxytetrahydrobiopterin dehydratase
MPEGLTRAAITAAVGDLGWRLVLGVVRTSVPVDSLAAAAAAAGVVADAASVLGADAGEHVWCDVRADRLVVSVQTRTVGWLTPSDLDLVRDITAALAERGLAPDPGVGAGNRSVQVIEIGIDALDIPAVRPFWKAVLGYVDELPTTGPEGPLVDPHGQGPAVWFQQMDAPRPQRNRLHFDVAVPHDEAAGRIAATLAAGGTLLSDKEAPAFWVLGDPEGNEACITMWQGRDPVT